MFVADSSSLFIVNLHFSVIRFLSLLSHRSIGMLYLFLSVFSGFNAFILSVLIRFELSMVNVLVFDVFQEYNMVISSHGLLMIFFFVMPFSISAFGNLYIPVLLLCYDLIFPRLNMLSF